MPDSGFLLTDPQALSVRVDYGPYHPELEISAGPGVIEVHGEGAGLATVTWEEPESSHWITLELLAADATPESQKTWTMWPV